MESLGFAPVVYEHAAAFIDESPYRVSRDADLLFRAHAAAYEFYGHSPIAVGIDVYNVEAEAYGATVLEVGKWEVPSVERPLVDSSEKIPSLADWDPVSESRFGLAFTAAARLKDRWPDADVRIPVGGPFSIAATLLGLDNLLCESLVNPEGVCFALEFLARKQVHVVREAASRGFGAVLFDSASTPPLLSPASFRDLVAPALRLFRDGVVDLIGAPSFVMGGDTVLILEQLLDLEPGFLICPAETDQLIFMEKMRKRSDIQVRLNMSVSAVVAEDETIAIQELDRVISIAQKTAAPPRPLLVGTGVLPVDADPRRIVRLKDHVSRLV